jgi:hypothetical protein
MIRIFTTAFSIFAIAGAAFGQANDPAVVSCEMLVREGLPNTTEYRYVSAKIDGSAVTLAYETRDAGKPPVSRQMRCSFMFNQPTATWGFAPGLPEALLVAVSGALVHRGIYPIPRDATDLKPAP